VSEAAAIAPLTSAAAETATPAQLGLLSHACGLDLRTFRTAHVEERIRRALERERVSTPSGLVARLASDPAARSRFRRSVALSVSGMFRDPEQFDLLEKQLLPPLLDQPGTVTVWSAGCANGTELFSLAIVLERLGALGRARLLGSDLLEENVMAARRAFGQDGSLPQGMRARFERRDLAGDGPPAGKWRLILCRNVLIYLAPEARQAAIAALAGALARDGILLLGRSERFPDPASLGLRRVVPHAYRRVT
jgi:chemotaxis protein methyltransferase CheR